MVEVRARERRPLHFELFPDRYKFDLSLTRNFTDEEIEETIKVAENLKPWKPFIEILSKKFDKNDLKGIISYVLNKYIPRPYYQYWLDVSKLADTDNVSIETSNNVKEVTEYITMAEDINDAKNRINTVITKYVGLKTPYINPFFEILIKPFATMKLPYPPQRIGTPRALTLETSWSIVSFKDVDVAEIAPKHNAVFGPMLEDDTPIRCEVRATALPGKKAFLLTILWVLFELRWCWWVFRFWAPLKAGMDSGRIAVTRFNFIPNRQYTFAYRVHPIALNVVKCEVRRIA